MYTICLCSYAFVHFFSLHFNLYFLSSTLHLIAFNYHAAFAHIIISTEYLHYYSCHSLVRDIVRCSYYYTFVSRDLLFFSFLFFFQLLFCLMCFALGTEVNLRVEQLILKCILCFINCCIWLS